MTGLLLKVFRKNQDSPHMRGGRGLQGTLSVIILVEP